MFCFFDNYLCCKTRRVSDIVRGMISYTIIFLPLVIGMTIATIYSKKLEEDKYKNLKKPAYNPPNYVFGIVLTIIYLLVGIAYNYALYDSNCIPNKISKCGTTIYFKGFKYWLIPILALVFNFLYIPVFFGENGLFNSLIIIILSLVFAILTLIQFYSQSNVRFSKIITFVFIAYIIWLCFLTYLSYHIYALNVLE